MNRRQVTFEKKTFARLLLIPNLLIVTQSQERCRKQNNPAYHVFALFRLLSYQLFFPHPRLRPHRRFRALHRLNVLLPHY
jgi:hypothetical protein